VHCGDCRDEEDDHLLPVGVGEYCRLHTTCWADFRAGLTGCLPANSSNSAPSGEADSAWEAFPS
jgi:hypothetical protein